MLRSTRFPVLILAALAVAAPFSPALAGGVALQPGSQLWLEGKSTIHEFKSTASSLKVTFEQNEARWPKDATGGAAVERFVRGKCIESIEVVVGVTGLHSGKDGLDKNMNKALKASKYPEIRFKMTNYEITDGKTPAEMAIEAKGKLTVAGVEREIHLPLTAVRDGEAVRLRGSTPLLMSQYGIKPPKMMMGTLKTSDEVVIHFDLAIGAKQPTDGISKAE